MASKKEYKQEKLPVKLENKSIEDSLSSEYLISLEDLISTEKPVSNEFHMSIEEAKTTLETYYQAITFSFNIHDVPFSDYIETLTQLYNDYKKNYPNEEPFIPSFLPQDQRNQLGLRRTTEDIIYKKPGTLTYYIDAVTEGLLLCLEYKYLMSKSRGNLPILSSKQQ